MLRQFVRLTGLGIPSFDDYLESLERVKSKFTHKAGFGMLDTPGEALYEGHRAIDLHTRYLTERRLVEGERHIPFPPDIDPNQALEEVRGGNLIRVEDNVVQYMKKISNVGQSAQ